MWEHLPDLCNNKSKATFFMTEITEGDASYKTNDLCQICCPSVLQQQIRVSCRVLERISVSFASPS